MNTEERSRVGEMWVGLSEMFGGRELTKAALGMMLNSIDDLEFSRVEKFMKNWAMTSKIGRHPLPAEVREAINPTPDHSALAMEATGRVIQGIAKFGFYSPVEAKAWIGDLGWRGIQRFGGWAYLCENLGRSIRQDTFTAQMRDILRAQLDLGSFGIVDEPVMLTSGRQPQAGLTKASDIPLFHGKSLTDATIEQKQATWSAIVKRRDDG